MSWEIRYWIWRSNVIEMIHLIHLHVIWNRCLKFYRRKTRSNSTVSQVFQKSNWNCNESHKSKTMPHTTILFTIFNQNVSISHLSYPTVERKKNSFKWQKLAGFCWNIRIDVVKLDQTEKVIENLVIILQTGLNIYGAKLFFRHFFYISRDFFYDM